MTQSNPNKRMFYLWPENVEFYEALENKSDFINQAIKEAKRQETAKMDDRIAYVHKAVENLNKPL